MDATVCVGTFGGFPWLEQAKTAMSSALRFGVPIVHVHAESLSRARNLALRSVETEFVCFLDADDELERGYFGHLSRSQADIRVPSVLYCKNKIERTPWMPQVAGHEHACQAPCLIEGNWLVIGSVARTELIREVGGFRDFPVYEDYDLWLRCFLAGATIEAIPEAIYRAHVRSDSRNRGSLSPEEKHLVHQEIARANGVNVPA